MGERQDRRLLWKAANSGNTTMLIWMGKQYLGQRDRQDLRHGAQEDLPVQFTLKIGE